LSELDDVLFTEFECDARSNLMVEFHHTPHG
jgi:hypothetical protein